MNPKHPTTFASVDAVEAWDQWFRLRVDGRLRDITVNDTWSRAANALVARCPRDGAQRARRYVAAFSTWKLLPNAHWIQHAGTPAQGATAATGCVINLMAHLGRTPAGWTVDEDALRDTAALAVRLADDIVAATGLARPACAEISVMGAGSALGALGLAYETPRARLAVQRCLRVIAEAAWQASAALARERGPAFAVDARIRAQLGARGLPAATVQMIERSGLRFRCMTRLAQQPLLARMAGVTDALEPAALACASPRRLVAAELKLRSSVQRWIDEALDVPLAATPAPAEDHDYFARLARRLHVPMPFVPDDGRIGLRTPGAMP